MSQAIVTWTQPHTAAENLLKALAEDCEFHRWAEARAKLNAMLPHLGALSRQMAIEERDDVERDARNRLIAAAREAGYKDVDLFFISSGTDGPIGLMP
jgi:hypothetical protein